MSRMLTLSGRAFTIVGVAPEDCRGVNELYGEDSWTPMAPERPVRALQSSERRVHRLLQRVD